MNDDILNSIMQNIVSLPPPQETNNTRSSDLTENQNENTNEIKDSKNSPEFSLDTISKKSISLLGFNLYFDDIIIISMILFLIQEEKRDYLLIGILALMLFDLSIDKLQNFEPIKKLISNFS